ncbi:MAG: hypothetical protein WC589_04395 [Sphingobacterium sp.]|uniref:hypothetical protein n=1 Tax=Sphingobacterium paramultivorum TaxID=2886510 RepID=UPI001D17FA76|nr:hypothetical protein [Sphingobacterium paramultivorum]WSO12781.1 hypothetical protein VUL84_15625 [Sphingobacterium paramultivorum]
MELKKSSAGGIEADSQNRDNAVGIGVGLPELKEVCWSWKRPVEIAKGLFRKVN